MFAAVERGLQKDDYLPANANPRLALETLRERHLSFS
jgi:hypothetical protein